MNKARLAGWLLLPLTVVCALAGCAGGSNTSTPEPSTSPTDIAFTFDTEADPYLFWVRVVSTESSYSDDIYLHCLPGKKGTNGTALYMRSDVRSGISAVPASVDCPPQES